MIYTHIWESKPFLKQLYRFSLLCQGKAYPREIDIPDMILACWAYCIHRELASLETGNFSMMQAYKIIFALSTFKIIIINS